MYDIIIIEFGISMKIYLRLINMCLNGTYSRARLGKYLPDVFTINSGFNKDMIYRHFFSTLLLNMPLEGFR